MNKNVITAVGIPSHQVAGIRSKRHIKPIPADAGQIAVKISLGPGAVHRYSGGRRGDGVVNKDVVTVVVIPRHQVAGIRLERHITPISADAGLEAGLEA